MRLPSAGSFSQDAQLPGDGARVRIPAGITVTVDGAIGSRLDLIRLDGQLTFAPEIDTALAVETLLGMPGSHFTMGTANRLIDDAATARLNIAATGPIDRDGDPMALSCGMISAGCVTIAGAQKTAFVALSRVPAAGARVLQLGRVPQGWQVGDQLRSPSASKSAAATDNASSTPLLTTCCVEKDPSPSRFSCHATRSPHREA